MKERIEFKDARIVVVINSQQKQALLAVAREHGLSLSSFLLYCALEKAREVQHG